MDGGLLGLTIELCACSGKALHTRWQNNARLGRLGPYVTAHFHRIRVVIAAAGNGADFRPALKRQADRGATGWAKVNIDVFLAAVRHVRVLPKFTLIELNGLTGIDRFRVVRRARHPLTEGAVAGKCPHRRLQGAKSNLATEAAAFKYNSHGVDAPVGLGAIEWMNYSQGAAVSRT